MRCPACQRRLSIPRRPEPFEGALPPPLSEPPAEARLHAESPPLPPPLPVVEPPPIDPVPPGLPETPAAEGGVAPRPPLAPPPAVGSLSKPTDSGRADFGGVPDTETPPPLPEADGPEATNDLPGWEHPADRLVAVYLLGLVLLALALFGMVPAAMNVADVLSGSAADRVSRWSYVLLLAGLLQLGYAAYLVTVPDWSSVWMATLLTLLLAGLYALMLAVTLLGGADHSLVINLDLADQMPPPGRRFGKASAWCFAMLGLTCLFAYFGGRLGTRWHSSHVKLLRARGWLG